MRVLARASPDHKMLNPRSTHCVTPGTSRRASQFGRLFKLVCAVTVIGSGLRGDGQRRSTSRAASVAGRVVEIDTAYVGAGREVVRAGIDLEGDRLFSRRHRSRGRRGGEPAWHVGDPVVYAAARGVELVAE
jgi:hypothetical protein